jgi:hypothetical protein
MTRRARRNHSAAFKAKVALAANNRGIADDSETLEMTSEVFRRARPEPAAPSQRKEAG